VIDSDQRWRFSELLTEDGAGVIELWMNGLPDAARIGLEVRLIQWAAMDRWIESYATVVEIEAAGERVEPLLKLRFIELLYGGVVYRVFGTDLNAREFVMLLGDTDHARRAQPSAETIRIGKERLEYLRENPERRQEYEI
jgi:hypothetical protein